MNELNLPHFLKILAGGGGGEQKTQTESLSEDISYKQGRENGLAFIF